MREVLPSLVNPEAFAGKPERKLISKQRWSGSNALHLWHLSSLGIRAQCRGGVVVRLGVGRGHPVAGLGSSAAGAGDVDRVYRGPPAGCAGRPARTGRARSARAALFSLATSIGSDNLRDGRGECQRVDDPDAAAARGACAGFCSGRSDSGLLLRRACAAQAAWGGTQVADSFFRQRNFWLVFCSRRDACCRHGRECVPLRERACWR